MKMKLFQYTGYLLFIILTFTSCMNEMDVIENGQDLEANNEQLYFILDPKVNALINYDGSTRDKNVLSQVENLLQCIYGSIPEIRRTMDRYINDGVKFRISVKNPPRNGLKAWYDPNDPPEIGFSSKENITLGNLLHELLHTICFDVYEVYQQGLASTCEEYEVRVLTDVFMRHYFSDWRYTYQGIHYKNNSSVSYINWLDNIIYDNHYRMEDFAWDFKQHADLWFGEIRDEILDGLDLKNYMPLLLKDFWFLPRK